jgi:hypothetical protein
MERIKRGETVYGTAPSGLALEELRLTYETRLSAYDELRSLYQKGTKVNKLLRDEVRKLRAALVNKNSEDVEEVKGMDYPSGMDSTTLAENMTTKISCQVFNVSADPRGHDPSSHELMYSVELSGLSPEDYARLRELILPLGARHI